MNTVTYCSAAAMGQPKLCATFLLKTPYAGRKVQNKTSAKDWFKLQYTCSDGTD